MKKTLLAARECGAKLITISGGVSCNRQLREPRLADRALRLTVRPTDDDRRKLTQLVALVGMPELVAAPALAMRLPTGEQAAKRKGHEAGEGDAPHSLQAEGRLARFAFLSAEGMETLKGWSTGFTSAPAWDEDHPEEAAYRPFPLAPFLTATASIDDPALAKLVHPDLTRTGELFETSGVSGPMRLQPARQVARLLWSQEASEREVDIERLSRASNDGAVPRPIAARRVQTETAR